MKSLLQREMPRVCAKVWALGKKDFRRKVQMLIGLEELTYLFTRITKLFSVLKKS